MRQTASAHAKKISRRRRAVRIEFAAPQDAATLVLRLHLEPDVASRVSTWANASERHHADASAIVRKAAEDLKALAKVVPAKKRERDRGGIIQGNIPRELSNQLKVIAEAKGLDAAEVVLRRIFRWLDPRTGRRRPTKLGDGDMDGKAPSRRATMGPTNLQSYTKPSRERYLDARRGGAQLVRFQVSFSPKAVRRFKQELHEHRVGHAEFLTAVIDRICNRASEGSGTLETDRDGGPN